MLILESWVLRNELDIEGIRFTILPSFLSSGFDNEVWKLLSFWFAFFSASYDEIFPFLQDVFEDIFMRQVEMSTEMSEIIKIWVGGVY